MTVKKELMKMLRCLGQVTCSTACELLILQNSTYA